MEYDYRRRKAMNSGKHTVQPDDYIGQTKMKSSWPDLPAAPDRPTKSFYVVDQDGVTIGKAATSGLAKAMTKGLTGKVEIRFVEITEESLQRDEAGKRADRWVSQIYKPQPTRNLR